jgi:hypothetical protein
MMISNVWASMFGNGSKQAESELIPQHLFVTDIKESLKNDDVAKFKEMWDKIKKVRTENYEKELLENDIMESIKEAFRHQKPYWRKEGIAAARSFFHKAGARRQLMTADFIGSVLLITLPEPTPDEGGEAELNYSDLTVKEKEQEEYQIIAAETFDEMADYDEFRDGLCNTSVLNFLCIVLNQVKAAQAIVTETFVKLSSDEKNLVPLMEGAMGDMLETFFKTVKIEKPPGEENDAIVEEWRIGTKALGNTARALATLVKHRHPCQVDMPTIIKVFAYSLALSTLNPQAKETPVIDIHERSAIPDNVRLLAELSQLFFWKCRNEMDTCELVRISAPRGLGSTEAELDYVLRVLVAMWRRCVETHEMLAAYDSGNRTKEVLEQYKYFCVDDLSRLRALDPDKDEDHRKALEEKKENASKRLCYLNCTLWVLLPISSLRWKLRAAALTGMDLAFGLRETEYLNAIVATVRYLVDLPEAQESSQFIKFFGEQLLKLLGLVLDGVITDQKVIETLMDAVSILAMNRHMQKMLAREHNIFSKCEKLKQLPILKLDSKFENQIELAVLRCMAEVAIHPCHRLSWVVNKEHQEHPPRKEFQQQLQSHMKGDQNDNLKTIASLLLTLFQEEKFRRPASDISSMFRSVFDWWTSNTTTRLEEAKRTYAERDEGSSVEDPHLVPKTRFDLQELISHQREMQDKHQYITVQDSSKYCAPHECVMALSLFSRLALEPKFKPLFMQHECLDALLGCISVGIWAEAREAAATIANLMWVPDLQQEFLVCWLKFDSAKCITVDASNVLLPMLTGTPKPVDIGKGMYKSSWGIEFTPSSCVTLHPDGLKTHELPGLLTSASPTDTFAATSLAHYAWLESDKTPNEKNFSITCWFYWPLPQRENVSEWILLHSTEENGKLIYVKFDRDSNRHHWILRDSNGGEKVFHGEKGTPKINDGWHMMSIVSDAEVSQDSGQQEGGTQFWLDDWNCKVDNFWMPNDFYVVGNRPITDKSTNGTAGGCPFGLITDFRIYAKPLGDEEVKMMAKSRDTDLHPDRLVRALADRDAATILAQRLDVPDSAAECLRALGSLATLSSQRAKIFSVCGRRVLQMIDSPLNMIQRQAARLINNIT